MTDRKIEWAICAFLSQYRKKSHVGEQKPKPEGAYYWSEQDAQFELLEELRRQFKNTKYSVHAEGIVLGRKKGERSKRADIVIVNSEDYLKWHSDWVEKKEGGLFPEYEALIELKMVWRGLLPRKDHGKRIWRWGGATPSSTDEHIRNDLKKLAGCLRKGPKKDPPKAHLILLDSVIQDERNKGQHGPPYYSGKMLDRVDKLRKRYDPCIHLWHWPDFEEGNWADHISEAPGQLYHLSGHKPIQLAH
jgi:hypothetical protein